MFNVKRNQIFESRLSENRIRVRNITPSLYDTRYSVVTIVNIGDNGKALKNTERRVYQDSIRRRYQAA